MNRSVTFRPRRFVALFLLFLFFAAPATLFSEDGLDELLERSESEGNLQQLIDDLQELRKKKISLNETDGSDLLLLPFLDASDVEKILRRRREKGPITSTWDLEALIGSEKARSAEPYILFTRRAKTQKREMKEVGGSLTSRVFWENPPRKGIETGKYAGENNKVYNRLMADIGHFGLSVVRKRISVNRISLISVL